MGQPTIILGSLQASLELLDHRGMLVIGRNTYLTHTEHYRSYLFRQARSSHGRRTVSVFPLLIDLS